MEKLSKMREACDANEFGDVKTQALTISLKSSLDFHRILLTWGA
ncbi:MAG: hypothetical protein AB7S94_07715 [Simkaniaceae bacterium]|jgi:hypothetical protein